MTVHDGNDPKRLFIWRRRDKVIPHALEPDKVVCEIRAAVSLMRNWRQTAQCVPDFSNHAVGGAAVFDRNIFPNLVKIGFRFWMEIIAGHVLEFAR